MAPSLFRYRALEHPNSDIRLLELLPGSGRVQCRLKVVKLSENTTPYEPLSYCWGEQTRRVSILVDDAPFDIGVNLHAALKRLRLESQIRMLWVDAICINQHEKGRDEKSSQVSLMRHIFQGGQRTLAWLGEHDGKTALAFRIIEFLSEYAEKRPYTHLKSERWHEFQRMKFGKVPVPSNPFGRMWARWQRIKAVSALHSIFDRSWFRRVWVIQELAVSRQALLICGIHTIEWDTVEFAYKRSLSRWGMDDYLDMLSRQRQIYQRRKPQEPAKLILAAAGSEATDSRDRIYVMLGLQVVSHTEDELSHTEDELSHTEDELSHTEDEFVHVEMSYTVDAQDLFMDITKTLFQVTRDAGLLTACIGCQDPKMRSWALRYEDTKSSIPHSRHLAWQTQSGVKFLPTTGDSVFECQFADNDKLLGISGLVIDSIIAIGPVLQPCPSCNITKDVPLSFWIDCIRCYLSWRAMAGLNEVHDLRWDEAQNAFIQMLWHDSEGFNLENYTYDQYRERFEKFDKLITDNFSFLETKNSAHGPSKPRQLTDSVRAISVVAGLMLKFLAGGDFLEVGELYFDMVSPERRRMAKTQMRLFGLVPAESLPGDKVVLIAGSSYPFILRPSGGSRYKLVGDSYIHDIMDGTAWDETRTTTMWLE